VAPGAAAGTPPRPEYDPSATTLMERERAKAAELAAAGRDDASERTLRRKRKRSGQHELLRYRSAQGRRGSRGDDLGVIGGRDRLPRWSPCAASDRLRRGKPAWPRGALAIIARFVTER
jgi:hypothetical protein